MKAKLGELFKVWEAFDFMDFPRMVGDPVQMPIYNRQEFARWFIHNTGKAICFTSHNSYPELDKNFHPPRVIKIRVSNLFDDFDDKEKPENAQLDTIKMIKFCEKEGLDFLNSFSGSKGFHHYTRLKPKVYDYNDELKLKTRAVHNWFKDQLEFRTMDVMCKEPRRLCRIPYSKYAREGKHRGEYVVGSTYCIPMRADEIIDMDINTIKNLAVSPTLFIPKTAIGKWDLDEFIEHFSIDVREYSVDKDIVDGERIQSTREYDKVPADDFHELIKALVPRMCVHNDLFSRNPTHATRRMTVIQLKEIGYKFGQVINLFEEMSNKFGWVDRMFRSRRNYQIKHIYFHIPKYEHDTCGTIKNKHGLCIGKPCPKFRGGETKKEKSIKKIGDKIEMEKS